MSIKRQAVAKIAAAAVMVVALVVGAGWLVRNNSRDDESAFNEARRAWNIAVPARPSGKAPLDVVRNGRCALVSLDAPVGDSDEFVPYVALTRSGSSWRVTAIAKQQRDLYFDGDSPPWPHLCTP